MRLDAQDLALLVGDALAAVADAGRIVLNNWDAPSDVRRKGRIDLVTETDLAVEEALKESLSRLLPGSTFLGEESAASLDPGELTWIVDPLDGTTNFAHRLPFVATSVALWMGGKSVLGIVHAPALGETFHAVAGGGAFLNASPLAVSAVDRLEDALVATGFPYTVREDIRELMDWLEKMLVHTQGVRRPGAASIDLAYVAAGRFDVFYEVGLKPWDTAAGWLLVEEAGGRVTAFDPAQAYHLRSRSVLASNGPLHEAAAGLLA
ncbi:Inositol-1-monophosphatase [Fundidesulfovibrio magnetotacticus]|uniref:Inositol-1-monophosphatase n=1 Tax=Fundidesulfovibrio magnetotacticus TaxID=2730080 RepID=A0A6V8LRI7_9BACT|nr:inositol monophosphatase family protein [Fundidesulfovibrio magnetotacticus]GFK94334.1 Inositol-1-monophosphatase [Fundidesulfovibrio magnetotacticus]